ncbi:MAG: hypothetical protein OXU20_20725 [Myxococcales bacterium]|nr:hypothetical protein [Myxococcales bacterium]
MRGDQVDLIQPWVIGFALLVLVVLGALVMFARFYRKVDQGKALIINTMASEPMVTFTGGIVVPILHRAEIMEISVKTIDIDRRGKEGLICKDNIRADIKVAFFVRVNKTRGDVLKVAQSIGCDRASDQKTLETLFVAKFSEALKTVGKRMEFEELYTMRDVFRDQIIEVIGKDLNGYVLDDAAIDYLEQTQVELLDPQNILDAQGIRKITQMTAAQSVATNDLRQEERKSITRQNVDAQEKILEMERQQEDAVAKQKREVESIRAREEAETLRVQAEERQRSELARIKADEAIAVEAQNQQRQVEIAQKARERAVQVEAERVEKDRQLEAIARERETELSRIDKEKSLEVERKVIADTISQRIAVEKQVAEEEERIKDLRVLAEAKRNKDATVIAAEAQAQEVVVRQVKQAEAEELSAKHKASEQVTIAEAELESADRLARAKIRLAEGTQAEQAAQGLAQVRVKEADALAIEKEGKANAEANRNMLVAEAAGAEAKGMAEVKVKEAEAAAIERVGAAEAQAIKVKMEAEAAGLANKADAMQKLDGLGREHEEFRIRLEKDKEVELSSIAARKEVAGRNADILSQAMANARINLVGGDGAFLDQFFRAVSVGQSLDGVAHGSDAGRAMLTEYVDGDASFREDLKEVLTKGRFQPEDLKNLSLSALLAQMAAGADGTRKKALEDLLQRAKDLES